MPGLDHSGPEGQGPRTGRRMGTCRPGKDETQNAENEPRFFGRGLGRMGNGRGFGPGRGRGRGRGFGFGGGRGLGKEE